MVEFIPIKVLQHMCTHTSRRVVAVHHNYGIMLHTGISRMGLRKCSSQCAHLGMKVGGGVYFGVMSLSLTN